MEDAPSLAIHANNRAIWINLRDRMPHPYSLSDARAWIARVEHEEPRTSFVIDINGEAVGGIGSRLLAGRDLLGPRHRHFGASPHLRVRVRRPAIRARLCNAYRLESGFCQGT